MPQPKQPPATPKAPVRGDATAAPAPAVAPAESTAKAVAEKVPAAKRTRAKGGTAKPAAAKPAKAAAKPARPAAGKPAAATAAAAKPAKPGRVAAAPKAAPRGTAPKPPRKPPRAAAPRPAATPAPAPEPTSAPARDEALRANLASLRDLLAGGVVLTAQRLQEAVDEAVARGRITRRDAEELASGLLAAGREQTAELVADIEARLGRGRSDLESAGSITKGAVKGTSDRVLREVDKARRAAGLGRAFPILGYDALTPAQIQPRLAELTPAELRTVREHERRNANRAPVLAAVDTALG